MDWELIVGINVMAFSLLVLISGFVLRQQSSVSILVLHALVVVTGTVALYLGYGHVGLLVAAIFVLLILPPTLLLNASNRAYMQARFPAASRRVGLAAFLHPTPAMRSRARHLAALAGDDAERSAAALEALLPTESGLARRSLEATIARLRGRWDDVLSIVRSAGHDARGLEEFEVRALGELGRFDEMVNAYERCKSKLVGLSLRNVQLFVLAFCGQRAAVALLRQARRLPMHPDFVAYWDAIAACNAPGHREEGRGMLAKLAQQSGLAAVRAAAKRYSYETEARPPRSPSDASLAAAAAIAERWREAHAMRTSPLRRLPVTLGLLAANTLMFALEDWYGGVESLGALVGLGALSPAVVYETGEWWRLVAALFLHFGWPHFMVNMFALFVFGRIVETAFGSWRMLAIYALGGIGSMATVLAMMIGGVSAGDLIVGASGAIMALFGAWSARLVVRWRQSRDVLDRRPAILMATIIALQCAVDLSVPQVSFTAHISGFLIGFLFGTALHRGSRGAMLARGVVGGSQQQA
jgi:membrane associated rhomboid family serine protease